MLFVPSKIVAIAKVNKSEEKTIIFFTFESLWKWEEVQKLLWKKSIISNIKTIVILRWPWLDIETHRFQSINLAFSTKK